MGSYLLYLCNYETKCNDRVGFKGGKYEINIMECKWIKSNNK